jgi:hypothetical protein
MPWGLGFAQLTWALQTMKVDCLKLVLLMISWVHIRRMLPRLIAWVEFPFLTLFINIFGLGFYEGSTPIAIHINYFN